MSIELAISDIYFLKNKNIFCMRGWSVSNGVASHIKINVDGKYLGEAKINLPRNDVRKQKPSFNDEFPGWQICANYKKLFGRPREAEAVAYDRDGKELIKRKIPIKPENIGVDLGRALTFDIARKQASSSDYYIRKIINFLDENPKFEQFRNYVHDHSFRFSETMKLLKEIKPTDKSKIILDVAGSPYLFPVYEELFPNHHVVCIGENKKHVDDYGRHKVRHTPNIDENPLNVETNSVSMVFLFEVIEHLYKDPMLVLSEINRVLVDDGILVITTPNSASWQSMSKVFSQKSPAFWRQYMPFYGYRHVNEFSPEDLKILTDAAGFEGEVNTVNMYHSHNPVLIEEFLKENDLPSDKRSDNIVAILRKKGPVIDRYPLELYEHSKPWSD